MWGDEPFSWFQIDAWVGIVTAVATAATLIWAVVVAVQAEKRAEAAEDRESEREKASERAQASRVTTYKGRTEPSGDGGPLGRFTWPVIKVDNASDLPIFSVTVYGTIPDGDGMATFRSKTEASVPPGDVKALRFERAEAVNVAPEHFTWVVATFRDANEVVWVRTETGRLTLLPDDPEAAEQLLRDYLDEQWTEEARAQYAEERPPAKD
jgi:hypothetical protein